MPLLGSAVVAIWLDVLPEWRDDFTAWHDTEHIPERVAIPGFLRGRRYVARYGSPETYTLYEAINKNVLAGSAYLDRLNSPTPWTKRAAQALCNAMRAICEVDFTRGNGDGAFLLTLRFDVDVDRGDNLRERLIGEALPAISSMLGVVGVHLCRSDQAVSDIETAESKGRDVAVPNWIIMIESSSPESAEAACDTLLKSTLTEKAGACDIHRGLYELEVSRLPGGTDTTISARP